MVRDVLTEARLSAMQPDEAAAIWIARRAEDLSDAERQAFQSWLDHSPEHARAWADAQHAMHSFGDAEASEILRAMQAHARAAGPVSRMPSQVIAAAAMLLILLTGALVVMPRFISENASPRVATAARPVTYTTRRAETRLVMLADGSRMTLDAETVVEARFTDTARAVRLVRGRVFFDAAPDRRRPFSVAAGAREIEALGTRFDVRLRSGELSVTLVEGQVAIAYPEASRAPITLNPGQQYLERGDTALVRTRQTQVDEALDWQQGFATFDGDTLGDAAAELSRHSDVQLVVRDPSVAALRVSGRFRSGDVERFGRVIGEVHPVKLARRPSGQIELVARK